MEKLLIRGGASLSGQVRVAGAKNAVLPILAASLLSESPVEISNVPHLNDVTTMVTLLTQLGASVLLDDAMHLHVDASELSSTVASYDLVKTMRASILVLGPLLARYGSARVAFPGGCAIGTRPLDLHIKALEALGAQIEVKNGYLQANSDGRLRGASFEFHTVTVTGTENLLMAAVLAEGVTTIHNAALEPEVSDLALFLNKLGAKITGIGTSTLEIVGVKSLNEPGVAYSVMPDRIEAGTYLVAACMTRGSIHLKGVNPAHMTAILETLEQAGAELTIHADSIELQMHGRRPKSVCIETEPYPGMPTDMQAQFMALNSVGEGKGRVIETVFENRLMHVPELRRMGARLTKIGSNRIDTEGVERLSSAPVMATDLRASAGLLLAALNADGESCIERVYHIDRGYECIDEKLQALGATISRVT